MKERPILFKSEMVRAILEGRKTQTRRIIKFPPALTEEVNSLRFDGYDKDERAYYFEEEDSAGMPLERYWPVESKYKVGDRLWVREHCSLSINKDAVMYLDSGGKVAPHAPADSDNWCREWKTCPSIHMPRWASRINLEIINVSVERVQDISIDDAKAEGVDQSAVVAEWGDSTFAGVEAHIAAFARLWSSINTEPGSTWTNNPWVWVIEFNYLKGAI